MAAPAAVAVGKKAADNPGASVFLLILAGAVLVQGAKNLPNFFEWGWNRIVPFDITAPVDATIESVKETWETEYQLQNKIHDIMPPQDPVERAIFGDYTRALGPEDEESFGFWQTSYRGAREGLFLGMRSPWAPR